MPVPVPKFLGDKFRCCLGPIDLSPTAVIPARAQRLAPMVLAAACLALAPASGARAADAADGRPSQRDVLEGPVKARVIRVRDGDTLVVRARIWVGQEIVIHARIAGIDAPELRARCPRERALAERARDLVTAMVGGRPVWLVEIRNGKYAGRVLAGIRTEDGSDLARALLDAGLARPYRGGRRQPWCDPQP
ncbi:MAG: thermonuclease family protein [Alphaproteobacteria bacterium]